jgi:hypothetical protein
LTPAVAPRYHRAHAEAFGAQFHPRKTTTMRRSTSIALFAALLGTTAGCSYGSVAAHQNGKLYVARNDLFLFGALRKMYECTPDGAGNITCVKLEGRP